MRPVETASVPAIVDERDIYGIRVHLVVLDMSSSIRRRLKLRAR